MKKTLKILLSLFLILTLLFVLGCSSKSAKNQECGEVQIAEMNWASAQLVANIDQVILKNGYDCDASVVVGDTNPTFASMISKGSPDIAPEMWLNSFREPLEKAVSEEKIYIANEQPITGLGEGWWIDPATAQKYPELKTVQDVLARPDLFPYKEDSSKGAFHSCPEGWACRIVNGNLFRGFEMEEKGWHSVNPGSAAGLDGSIAKAVESGSPWFGYYWSPNAIIGKYKLVKIDFGVPYAGDEKWDNCLAKENCADPVASSWLEPLVRTVVSGTFKQNVSQDVSSYLEKRTLPGNIVENLLAYMNEKQASGSDAAFKFLSEYPDVWREWVSEEVFEKVSKAL